MWFMHIFEILVGIIESVTMIVRSTCHVMQVTLAWQERSKFAEGLFMQIILRYVYCVL